MSLFYKDFFMGSYNKIFLFILSITKNDTVITGPGTEVLFTQKNVLNHFFLALEEGKVMRILKKCIILS